MSTKARYRGGILEFYESRSQERVGVMAPVLFEDDFLGSSLRDGEMWTAIDTSSSGDTTPLVAADAANGILRLPLDSTSEAQVSGFTFGNQRPFRLNQGLVFEARVALQTLPTLVAEMVWGLAGDANAAADSVAEGIWFKADGSGAIVCESDDTSTNIDDVATGVTLTAGEFRVFLIDCTDPADIGFYIDGNRVAEGQTFDASAVPGLALQPYFHVAKASGAGLGTLDVDYVRVWQHRGA